MDQLLCLLVPLVDIEHRWCSVLFSAYLVWHARPSQEYALEAEKGRDGLAAIEISSHLRIKVVGLKWRSIAVFVVFVMNR